MGCSGLDWSRKASGLLPHVPSNVAPFDVGTGAGTGIPANFSARLFCADPFQKTNEVDHITAVLARAFLARVARMATKEDLKAIREEIATKTELEQFATKKDLEQFATQKDLEAVREEMAISFSTLGDRIVNAKDELQEQIAGLKYAKEIDELRARVQMLEQKVGIRPTRRAA